MKVTFVFVAIAALLGLAAAQIAGMPQFPSLVETAAANPSTDILNGKPLKVPIIVDPFAQAPGSDAAETMDRVTQVLTMEPPSAAEPVVPAVDQVDILEVLDVAAKTAAKKAGDKKGAKKASSKKAAEGKKTEKKSALSGVPVDQIQSMSAVKAEIKTLNALIKKAQKIQSELPKKRARLELLKKKLHSAAASTAKTIASKKAGAQEKVAGDVDSKIKTLKEKLAKLEQAKASLGNSISGLKSVAEGKSVDASLIAQVEEMI